ncbi:hypothetical protein O5F95_002147 [Enterococcus faecalis]|nr:hypothetical protein [Enterococcus faecalis]EKJ3567376.1 hypothetical protein [Enterococcus faecalis]
MGKTKSKIKKKKRRLKEKAIANGTYNKRGKNDDVHKMQGRTDCLEKDKYGHAKAKPCPVCNREGNGIRHEMKELGK